MKNFRCDVQSVKEEISPETAHAWKTHAIMLPFITTATVEEL